MSNFDLISHVLMQHNYYKMSKVFNRFQNLAHFDLSQVLHSWMWSKSWLVRPRLLQGTRGAPLSAAHWVKRRRMPRPQTALQFDLKIVQNCWILFSNVVGFYTAKLGILSNKYIGFNSANLLNFTILHFFSFLLLTSFGILFNKFV